MRYRTTVALLFTALIAYTLGAQGRTESKPEKSPHVVALDLVFQTQQTRIRELDRENWLHDVKERTWSAQRPFHPGTIDSTHLFDVSYRIAGTELAVWSVDTRNKEVRLVRPKKP